MLLPWCWLIATKNDTSQNTTQRKDKVSGCNALDQDDMYNNHTYFCVIVIDVVVRWIGCVVVV